VTVSGTDKLTADFSAHSFGGRLEGGYRFDAALLSVTPYAAVQVQAFRTPSYTESAVSGSNAFALTYDARTATATRTEFGLWFDKAVALDHGATLALRTRAAWAHDFNNDQSIHAAFQTLPGASFTVNGASAAPNAALLSAGAELRLVNNWSLAAKFDGEFASGARTYAGTGTVRYVW
jgi:outer membrane autotransporter protein